MKVSKNETFFLDVMGYKEQKQILFGGDVSSAELNRKWEYHH